MSYKKKNIEDKPCEQCHQNRWRTMIKGGKWQCRVCGYVRNGG